MKNLFNAFIFTIMLAAISFGQAGQVSQIGGLLDQGSAVQKPRIAVLEFTAEPNSVPANGTQTLQNGIVETMKSHEGNKGWIEIPSTSAAVRDLLVFNQNGVTPEAAVKIGKLLGVNYVMYGHITVFDGKTGVQSQVVEVATGKVKWIGTSTYRGTTYVNAGVLNNTEKVMKPVIQQLTASLKAADL